MSKARGACCHFDRAVRVEKSHARWHCQERSLHSGRRLPPVEMTSAACLFNRSGEIYSGSVPSLGRFLGYARNDAHYNYSSRGGADGVCCHFDRAKRVESTVLRTARSEWRDLMLGGTAKKDLSIPVAGSLQSR